MRIAFVGAGAVGGWFGGRLKHAGHDVVYVARGATIGFWEKAMSVICSGALGALTGQPLGSIRTRYRRALRALMQEVSDLAVARGVPLDGDTVARVMDFADRMPAAATSSMQRDLAAGDPGELDAQVGAMCRLARLLAVDVRPHDLLLSVLAPARVAT